MLKEKSPKLLMTDQKFATSSHLISLGCKMLMDMNQNVA
jgi:hypothetical protein